MLICAAMIGLNDDMKKRLVEALTDGRPVVAAYVSPSGDPQVAFYGSIHAYSDSELALWVRNPKAEFLDAIQHNPKVGFMYSDMSSRVFYRMYGRAARTSDESALERIFEGMHQLEQGLDPDRKGVAVLVELDEVAGRDQHGEMFSMTRA